MIDIENLVFDTVYQRLQPLWPEANITAGYDEKRAQYPAVIIRETGNLPFSAGNTDDCAENYSRITFEIEVESNKKGTARSECKAILNDADRIMQEMKFRRIHKNRPLNTDRTVYRQYARYEVIAGKPVTYDEGTENERTVVQMYRR